jgi:TonB-dependent receptor
MRKTYGYSSASLGVLALALCGVQAHAQSAPVSASTEADPGAKDAVAEGDTIVVTGFRGSLERSLEIKRNASGISDAITAEDIGKFPDLNISESLQRIPGVALDRTSTGEGRSINLRGLGPEFTLVEINGLPGTSNGSGGRFGLGGGGREFNFEILAAELFSSAVVNKTSLPQLIEGGLAGTVQLQTPRPFDQKQGWSFAGAVLGNYSELADKLNPRGSALFSYNGNDKIGVTASVAFAETDLVSNLISAGSWRPFANANSGVRAPDNVRAALSPNVPGLATFREDRRTFGSTLTIQARPSDQLELTLDGIYGKLKNNLVANRNDAALEGGISSPTNVTIQDGVITAGTFTGAQQRVGTNFIDTDEEFYQFSGGLKWQPNEYWTITPLVGYSSRTTERAWDLWSFRLANAAGAFDPGSVSYNIRGDFLDLTSTATDFASNPQNFLFNVLIRRPNEDKDTEFTAKIDLQRDFDGALSNIKFGARYSDRQKDRAVFQTRLQRPGTVATNVPPSLGNISNLIDFEVRGSNAPGRTLVVDRDAAMAAFFPNGSPVTGTVINSNFRGSDANATFSINEKTFAAYGQAEFNIQDLNVVTGLRFVRTQQNSTGFSVAALFQPSERITPVSVDSSYSIFLPSLAARWEVAQDVIVRAAYSRTLTRPDLFALAPSENFGGIDQSGGTGSIGNPNLQPFTSDNVDLGVEWYFDRDSFIGANIFHKSIDGFIDTRNFVENRTFPRQADGVLVTGPITFAQPVNGVSATITGLEVGAQSRLGFIAPALDNFGFIVNYSYTESSADFAVVGDVRTRGLPGLSRNSYNAIAYFDNGTFDARFSYAWRDRYLAQFSDDFGIPRFTDAFGQLDFSSNYNINQNFSIQLQALNLTKAQVFNQSTGAFIPYSVTELDRRFLIGGRFKF